MIDYSLFFYMDSQQLHINNQFRVNNKKKIKICTEKGQQQIAAFAKKLNGNFHVHKF